MLRFSDAYGLRGINQVATIYVKIQALTDPESPVTRTTLSSKSTYYRGCRMFGLFKKDPLKQWQKEYDALLTQAFEAQRNGNIRLYSTLTAEAEGIREKIAACNSGGHTSS